MVIDDLDGLGTRLGPPEADAPLIVDANTVLTRLSSLECFESVTWRHLEIIESGCNLQLPQLSPRHGLNVHKAPDAIAPGEGLRIRATE